MWLPLVLVGIMATVHACKDAQTCARAPRASFDITDFGAIGNGVTVNTAAIQQTIAYASSQGGGDVVVPAGDFLTGGIFLASGVYLYVAEGGNLIGSTALDDYPANNTNWTVVFGINISYTGISGPGTINGQAVPAWVDYYNAVENKLIPKTWSGK